MEEEMYEIVQMVVQLAREDGGRHRKMWALLAL